MPTNISWTDESWNPVTGCSPVSPGCAHCYAAKLSKRFGWSWDVTLHPDRLEIPLKRKKPTTYFVPSMGDLFHEDVPLGFVGEVFDVMTRAKQHTFQVLTKRPGRMRDYLRRFMWPDDPRYPVAANIWLGVSVENQKAADERYEYLRDTPAAVRFYSIEPLLGPIPKLPLDGISWVIVGGESGGPPERRLVERHMDWRTTECAGCDGAGWRPKPEALGWVRDIRDQCQAAGVAFYFKQWGPRAGQGTLVDGVEHKAMPEVRV